MPSQHVTRISHLFLRPSSPQAPEFFERFQDEAVGNAVTWEMFRRFRGFGLKLPEDEEAQAKAKALRQRLQAAESLFQKLDSQKTGLVRCAPLLVTPGAPAGWIIQRRFLRV